MKSIDRNESGYVNSSENFTFSDSRPDVIRLTDIIPSIDRIKLNIRYRPLTFNKILSRFKQQFTYKNTDKDQTRLIRSFTYSGKLIQLVEYLTPGSFFWFPITIHDPDEEIQLLVRDIIFDSTPKHWIVSDKVKVSEIEFALDFYPEDLKERYALNYFLDYLLVLKFSRVGSYRAIKTTSYQANSGHIRSGSKGLRIYPRRRYVRVELQLNRKMMKSFGLELSSLPIDPRDASVLDFVDIRKGLDGAGTERLTDSIIKKACPQFKQKYARGDSNKRNILIWRTKRQAYRSLVANIVSEYQHAPCDIISDPIYDRPVAAQLSRFKELKKKYGLTTKVNDVFPAYNKELFINDLGNLMIKRCYW